MAEYVVSNESDVSLMPSNLNIIESASIPLAGLTVYQSLVDIAKLLGEYFDLCWFRWRRNYCNPTF